MAAIEGLSHRQGVPAAGQERAAAPTSTEPTIGPGVDLRGADLRGRVLRGVSLAGANLAGADLGGADLSGADLRGADLSECRAQGVSLGHARLDGARLDGAVLHRAHLCGADLRAVSAVGANLKGAQLLEVDARGADFSGADLREANLEHARVDDASFDRADLRHAVLCGVTGYATASWIHADIRDADIRGAFLLRRHVLDENFLFEFRTQSHINAAIYRVWKVTSDCGRSFVRWGLWTALIAVLYAAAYLVVDVDLGAHPTPLSTLYFSVVTLTTLGYGDVLPRSLAAQCVVMSEVTVGYVMLGGLLSIFANKMARRAD